MLNVKVRWTVQERVAGKIVTTTFDTKDAAQTYAFPPGGYHRGVRRSVKPPRFAQKTMMGAAMFAALQREA